MSSCCETAFRQAYGATLDQMVAQGRLTEYEQNLIERRYVSEVESQNRKYVIAAVCFTMMTTIVTVSGLIITSLASVLQGENYLGIESPLRPAITWVG